MLGLAVDPQFATNGYVFVCMASTAGAVDDVRVVRFTLTQNGATVLARQDVLTGLPFTRPALRLPAALRPRQRAVGRHRRFGDRHRAAEPAQRWRQGAAAQS